MVGSIIVLLLMFALGWWAFRLADSKGRNPYIWMIATVIIVVPIFVLLMLPSKTSTTMPQS